MIVGWFPYPLLPLEERILVERGAHIDMIDSHKGYLIECSLGTMPYEKAQELRKNALEVIKQTAVESYLFFWCSSND